MDNLVGQKLGKYQIESLIGRGGMASVYLARQGSLARAVAVKVLPPNLLHDETFIKRFEREADASSRMQHPRIVPVHDFGEENGIPYIVMAFIDGGSLAQKIKDKGPLPLEETARLLEQIAEGLDYAHQHGIIHRDFKPSNILLDKNNNAYLSDFGIAKVSQETAQLTGSGIVGTPTYMAPEMFKQELPTPAVDIYALGITLYQMLSGQTPYEGTTPVQLMYAHLNEPVPMITSLREDVPPELQIVLDKAMAKNPAERYVTAGDMTKSFQLALRGELTADAPATATLPANERKTSAPVPVATIPEVSASKENAVSPDREGQRKKRNQRVLQVIVALLIVCGVINLCSRIGDFFNGPKQPDSSDSLPAFDTRPISTELGDAKTLDVTLRLSAGHASVEALSEDNTVQAMNGTYDGRGDAKVTPDYQVLGDRGILKVEPENEGDMGFIETIEISLIQKVPIKLDVNSGAGELVIDLSELMLEDFRLLAGAGQVTLTLPEFGNFDADLKLGAGETILNVPDDLEVRIEYTGGLSTIEVSNDRFTDKGDGVYETDNFGSAENQVRITIAAGIGSVKIR
jgi:serine/threonine protein kinase